MTTATATAPVVSLNKHRSKRRSTAVVIESCHDCGRQMTREGIFCDPCISRDEAQG